MIAYVLSKLLTMVYGLLYPAYCSYKAVKTKDVKEYVHWMMYWIVFSIFSFFEVFADTFVGCWFPFYYELKILFMIWMLSPTTRGGSILYRRVIHPSLSNHEHEIDAYIAEFKIRTSNFIVEWGARTFSYVSAFVMTTMLRIKPGDEGEELDLELLALPNMSYPCDLWTPAVAGAGEFRMMNKANRSYSYENIRSTMADVNRNNRFQDVDSSFQSEIDDVVGPSIMATTALDRRFIAPDFDSDTANESRSSSVPHKSTTSMSFNELLSDVSESQQEGIRRSSRRKKEFENFSTVAQDMNMPLVFGWYPPNMHPAFLSTSSNSSFPCQDFSQMQLPRNIRPDLMLGASTVRWVDKDCSTEVDTQKTSNMIPNPNEECSDPDSETFFECDVNQPELSQPTNKTDDKSNIKPYVKMVSKTVLQEFDPSAVKLRVKDEMSEVNLGEETQKRNSLSAISKPSSSRPQSPRIKVKKSLSNSDLKVTKVPVLSSSSFRRVFSPFAPKSSGNSAAKQKRTGSKDSSTASLNVGKEGST